MKSQKKLEDDRQKVFDRANSIFKDTDKAMRWLNTPCLALGGQIPSLLLNDASGVELVLNMLGRIEHGVFV